MKLIESFLTNNPCYKAKQKITVKGLMLHSVGCNQPSASAFITSWNKDSYERACVHGFIDGNDGTVYQTLPWNHRGWHAGGAANNTHSGNVVYAPNTAVKVPFLVEVPNLDIYKGAGTDYGKTGKKTDKGVFTIVEVKNGKGAVAGWGKLKSGVRWIALDTAKRI